MEKKTMGGFIAALRKANGMTQKELAEKLNVSDKAVSRWERDECAPDLSLIPVIADIFGVTSDELLRGERKSESMQGNNPTALSSNELSAKSQKQIKYMLRQSLLKYKLQCIASATVAMVGFITAATVNTYNYAHLAFGVGTIIYIIAVVLLVIFAMLALSRANDDEIDSTDTNRYKKSVANATWLTASVIFIMFCITLPLALVYDSYCGLVFSSWFAESLVYACIGLVICTIAKFSLVGVLISRGIISADEKFKKNRKMAFKVCIILAAALAVTAIGHLTFNSIADSEMLFAESKQFDNYDDFKKYMEMPMPPSYDANFAIVSDDVETISGSDYQNSYNEEIITDKNGNELCRFINRNEKAVQITYSSAKDYLPIKVYEDWSISHHNKIMDALNIILLSIYVIEIITACVVYRKKRAK